MISTSTFNRPDMVLFWKPPCSFSQWTKSKFIVDGQEYLCAEQFMMAEKARLFGDEKVRQSIIETGDPKAHKALGRKVSNFDDKVWEEQRMKIVERGNIAKFEQNPMMLRELLATGDKLLVEASPLDKIWGIGLGAENPKAWNPRSWRGKNLLGYTLMKVRSQLRQKQVHSHSGGVEMKTQAEPKRHRPAADAPLTETE